MTETGAVAELKRLQKLTDLEHSHVAADTVLCEFLKSLGYERVVKEWEKVGKWYA